ncbi:MAG: DUF6259 domain-containing protein, partial [Armatimonadota bacterium]|nr:DUF6259 domain-containing protein [Armatimonadota bacterium]
MTSATSALVGAAPVAFAFLCWTSGHLAAAPGGPLVVEGERLSVSIDRTTGAFVSLRDQRTGREWLAPGGGARLYEISLARSGADPVRLSLAEATRVRVRRSLNETQILAEAHGDLPVSVRVDLTVDPISGVVATRFSAKLPPNTLVQSVRFPVLSLPARLGDDGTDDRALLPACDGLEIHNPATNLQSERLVHYPGSASMQFLAHYDAGGGLFAAALDGAGYRKSLGFSRAGEALQPLFVHYPELQPRSEWTVPYVMALDAFTGDWQSAAALYRAWAETQPWARTPLWKRKDIPAWAFQPAFYYAVSLRGTLPEGATDRLTLLPAHVADYQRLVGAPVVAMLMSWEKHGSWVTPDYFPPYGGEDAFKTLTEALRQGGNHSLVFLSGLRWTLRKTRDGMNYNSEALFRERAEKWAIVGEDGKVQRFGKPDEDVGEYAQICPATPLAREILSGAVQRCQELGIDCVQVDQIVGGGMPPCYATHHGHPPGGGKWSAQAVYSLFEGLRREGRARNKNFLFLMEEPNEFFIPVLDAYHARDYAEARWPRNGAGVRGVPLFTFVYHHHCLGYGGDSAPITPNPSQFAALQHALNLVCGKLPAGAVWSRWQPAEGVSSDQISLLRSAAALWASPVGEALAKGRRLAGGEVQADPLLLKVPVQGTNRTEERTYPSVVHGAYALPDGRVARVYVNLGSQRIRLQVPIASLGPVGQRQVLTRYVVDSGQITQDEEVLSTPTTYPLT